MTEIAWFQQLRRGIILGTTLMTRFEELSRIQAAIEHGDEPELGWALEYCQMRLRIATRKDQAKYWRGIGRDVTNAVRSVAPQTDSECYGLWVLKKSLRLAVEN
jgi:hypothetical protein